MADLSFAEISASSRNAMLSIKVCKVLRQLKKNRSDLDRTQKQVLSRGAQLLSEVVQGSLLIERKSLEERASRADLKAYSHAISALEILHQAATDADVTEVFKEYRTHLMELAKGHSLGSDQLDRMAQFFGLLNEFFFRDVQKAPPPLRMEPVLSLLP
jgi:hypothetical protein